ncbi:2TM domain-containing protein [Lyngbya confervoides]|uniref:2TM domain-containing protein n=1 Tax=Lyngbya confervoides BDU141951 TaxID=1574623 RepID=A0ABD4T4G4_9CYAN|nr:2TM domain-containing protein [Lyngbya confervoides]MCM1983480.1 2TM domain-containing protein [Lyngbya confervoides BDU141951]
MPPRWPRKPDRNDPEYRKLDDRMTFAVHVALYLAVNSGLWFFYLIEVLPWPWISTFSLVWAILLCTHAIFIFTIAKYEQS